jgi:hypothetical protein
MIFEKFLPKKRKSTVFRLTLYSINYNFRAIFIFLICYILFLENTLLSFIFNLMFSANNFNNEIILYHRQQANRTLKIRIEESPIISKIDLKSWSSVEEEIPCDIVGVGAAGNSGKKGNKKGKPVKIRFHPEVLKEARKNVQLSEAAKLTAHKVCGFLALGSKSYHNRSKVGFTSQDLDYEFMRILDFQNFDQTG